MHVMQGRNKSDEVWKRDRGATVRFLDDRPKKAKGAGSAEPARERETENTTEGKKASARVFRSLNVTRTALPRSSDRVRARARAALQSGALCNAPLLLLNRALDRCRRTIKIASPTCQTYVYLRSIHFPFPSRRKWFVRETSQYRWVLCYCNKLALVRFL